ncbi:helix-turn-helix domain-containing protein [Nocardioides aurantiacus]|uniref:Helix-turn-helix protein n=1 Tax=Nocardioides aurantiacus TaxID=86796 RepID=A0A3N2CWX4_9ACTN|nr:helix-turn-helix transcriptional regulator [Nocardioides aurantiacus]ROR91714.1 helix-turn-helix protein [Nocardioides aurantiacus]
MDKADHGKRLKAAMASHGVSNEALADAIDVGKKTVYNWRAGHTMPSESDRAKLRDLLGAYDYAGDPVEAAVYRSELSEDRQHVVVGFYLRQLREQRAEEAS